MCQSLLCRVLRERMVRRQVLRSGKDMRLLHVVSSARCASAYCVRTVAPVSLLGYIRIALAVATAAMHSPSRPRLLPWICQRMTAPACVKARYAEFYAKEWCGGKCFDPAKTCVFYTSYLFGTRCASAALRPDCGASEVARLEKACTAGCGKFKSCSFELTLRQQDALRQGGLLPEPQDRLLQQERHRHAMCMCLPSPRLPLRPVLQAHMGRAAA